MVNWKVRFKNWHWVASFISQILIVAEMVITGLNMMGVVHFQLTDAVKNYILAMANAIFILLSMLGIVQDPTTKGYKDSENAMKYEEPK
ncbi:MAG: phage holin [Bacillota bacterium]|nr:phage holin [Bacillota bacterium]